MKIAGYEIHEKIGQGGMAQVFKGVQLSLKREVAIKALSKQLLSQKGFKERFNRESLIIAQLSNPYIIPIIERGITDDDIPYYVMEYIEGADLKVALAADKFNINQKIDICIQVCNALSYAHKNGVIHRDIKLDNILIDLQGNAKVMDFGIAQYYSCDIEGEKTQVGDLMGTLAYMSPEQHQSASLVSFKSDLYSLGVLMYKLFTKNDPIGRFSSPIELVPDLPQDLSEIILKCLETHPDKRPQSADEIKNILLYTLRGAQLPTEQKKRTDAGIKNIELLDVLREEGAMSVSLYQNKTDKRLLVIHKRPNDYPGSEQTKLLAILKHPHIANVIGSSSNKRFYITVMEYCEGGTLGDRMLQAMDFKIFLPIARSILSALLFAHNNRIIHGNLKPSNILFDQDNKVKLAEFGLINPNDKNYPYRNAKSPSSIQADIYAVGVIFYQLLTGLIPDTSNDSYRYEKVFLKLPAKIQELILVMLEVDFINPNLSCLPLYEKVKEIMQENTQTEIEQTVLLEADEPEVEPKPRQSKIPFKTLTAILAILSIVTVAYFYYPQLQQKQYLLVQWFSSYFFESEQTQDEEQPVEQFISF